MFSGVIFIRPIASACCLSSAMIETSVDSGTFGVIRAPFDVRPGHMMLAPCRTNWIAPLSTCISGQMNGSVDEEKCQKWIFIGFQR